MEQTMGKRIRALRKAYNMTLYDLAEAMEISDGFMGLVERDERGTSRENIKKICDIFNVTADYILFGRGEAPKMDTSDYNALIKDTLAASERAFLVDTVLKLAPCKFSESELKYLSEQFAYQITYLYRIRKLKNS